MTRRSRKLMLAALAVVSLGISQTSAAPLSDLSVTELQLIGTQRVGRSVFEYEYSVTVSNAGPRVNDVVGILSIGDQPIEVVDGMTSFDQIGGQQTVTSDDSVVLRIDRRVTTLDRSLLTWTFDGEPVSTLAVSPTLIGLTQQEAESALIEAGFVVGEITEEYSETVEQGAVISQLPVAGAMLESGSEVSIVVSLGAEVLLSENPALIGLTQQEAELALIEAGFVVGEITEEYSETVEQGAVISQLPVAGAMLDAGSEVSIVVSLGAEVLLSENPALIGLTQQEAESALTEAGFVFGEITEEYSETVEQGAVISQLPVAGAMLEAGSEVSVVVSLGAEVLLSENPALIGLTQQEAESALTEAGFVVGDITEQYSETVEQGNVISQLPVAGEMLEVGSEVSIVVSLGPDLMLVEVPSVAGLARSVAELELISIGLTLGEVTEESSESISFGLVISQDPAAGETVEANRSVDIRISTGPVSMDSDGDSIENAVDVCPDTPLGEFADETGCGESQLDTDNDGVSNALDECPGTDVTAEFNDVGCSLSQLDSDNDGFSDADDAFPNDSAETVDSDGDGIGDNADDDRDGDGVSNEDDFFPDDSLASTVPVVQLLSPASLTTVGSSPIAVLGTVDNASATIVVNGQEIPQSDGSFAASVALDEGVNTIVVRAIDGSGREGLATATVALDKTPPYITVQSPLENAAVSSPVISVGGLVNDIVRGTISENEAAVTVNGIEASVSNRSYLVEDVSLVEGENELVIRASDAVGNTSEINVFVSYVPQVNRVIELVSGQGQKADIQQTLERPLVVKLTEAGVPVADKVVVFRVIEGDGLLAPGTDEEGNGVVVSTNAEGVAEVDFLLGSRAGMGNHRVRARAVGFDGEAEFFASANYGAGIQLGVIAGNNQRGSIKQPLPEPFVIAVTDQGANLIPGAEIVWEVVSGRGKFADGEKSITTFTDMDGRASANFVLGSVEGLDGQRVVARLEGTEASAGFTISGFVPGDAGNTAISGVVLDNQDLPLPSVSVRVDGTSRQTLTDEEGQFTIEQVPVGPVKLIADGSTTTRPGEWPSLSFHLVTVPGVDNPMASPVYLVEIDTENAVMVGAEDVVVTHPEIPGFALEVERGSVTFPDGSREGLLSITRVNANKVPMPPPNGMQPQLIVTIQPHGAVFDPPARLTIPNTDGHLPNAEVEMYSYDHDLEEFVTIGLGTVTNDGAYIASNNGVGVIKAGWHCGSQPGGGGCGHNCGYCKDCGEDCNCILAPDRALEEQIEGNCVLETCGGTAPPTNDLNADQAECKFCSGGDLLNKDEGSACSSVSDVPYDCSSPGCVNGSCSAVSVFDSFDLSDEDSKCSVCSEAEMSVVPDEDKNNANCGDPADPNQACLVCRDGSCSMPVCEGEVPEVFTVGLSENGDAFKWANRFQKVLKALPVPASFEVVPKVSGKYVQSRECCKDCTKEEQVLGTGHKLTGSLGVGAELVIGKELTFQNEWDWSIFGIGELSVEADTEGLLGGKLDGEVTGSISGKYNFDCGEGCANVEAVGSLAGRLGFVAKLNKLDIEIESAGGNDGDGDGDWVIAEITNGGAEATVEVGSFMLLASGGIGPACSNGGTCTWSIGEGKLVLSIGGEVSLFNGFIDRRRLPGFEFTYGIWSAVDGDC